MTEVLMTCTRCDDEIAVDMDAAILRMDVEPLRLSEPSLPIDDRPPALPELTLGDLLSWHEQLAKVRFVTPWER